MSSIHDALPNDIYVDDNSKLWRVVSICHEPTVCVEEVEGTLIDPNNRPFLGGVAVAQGIGPNQLAPRIQKQRREGWISDPMWAGLRRIWRKADAAP